MSINVRAIVDILQVDDNELKVGDGQELTVHSHLDRDDLVVIAVPSGKQLSVRAKDITDAIRRCSG